jgi:hypothetical protein
MLTASDIMNAKSDVSIWGMFTGSIYLDKWVWTRQVGYFYQSEFLITNNRNWLWSVYAEK